MICWKRQILATHSITCLKIWDMDSFEIWALFWLNNDLFPMNLSFKFTFSLSRTLRVFICICRQHCERNSCHNVKTFLLSSDFLAQIVTHIWRAKAKICSTFAFNFFSNFGHLLGLFNAIFYQIVDIFFVH